MAWKAPLHLILGLFVVGLLVGSDVALAGTPVGGPPSNGPTVGIGYVSDPNGVPSYGGGGGGGNGIYYYELENANGNNLPWTSSKNLSLLNTDFVKAWTEQTEQGGMQVDQSLSNTLGVQPCTSGGFSGSSACVLWRNTNHCNPGSTSKTRTDVLQSNISNPACFYSGNVQTFPDQQELHTMFNASNDPGILDYPAVFNIRIWRGPAYTYNLSTQKATPDTSVAQNSVLWSRSVGYCASNFDTDPPSTKFHQNLWWAGQATSGCGQGGDLASEQHFAGPLGRLTQAQKNECSANLARAADPSSSEHQNLLYGPYGDNNPKHRTLVPYPVLYAESSVGLAHAYSKGFEACYWTIDTAHDETVYAQWAISGDKGNAAVSSLFYIISGGNPNKAGYYAVQTAQLDPREQMLLAKSGSSGGGVFSNGNFFQIMIPTNSLPPVSHKCPSVYNPPPCGGNPKTPPPPTPTPPSTPVSSPPPDPTVQITSDQTIPVRVRSEADVTVTPPGGYLGSDQALFPELINVYHWSPQLAHDGGDKGSLPNAYRTDYIEYDSDVGGGIRLAAPWTGPNGQTVEVTDLKQPVHSDGFTTSTNTFKQTWLHPTLENPCPEAQPDQNLSGSWPTQMTSCSTKSGAWPRNAWDDALWATADYEARWLIKGSVDGPSGWRSSESLRCFAQPGSAARAVAGCNPWFTLYNFSGPYYTTDAALTQYAMGYLYANPPDRDPKNKCWTYDQTLLPTDLPTTGDCSLSGATVHVNLKLKGAYAGTIVHSLGYVRGTYDQSGVVWDQQGGATSLHFCKPGVPTGSWLAIDGKNPSKANPAADDRAANPTEIGDIGCQGYAVGWNWDLPYTNPSPGYGIKANSSSYTVNDYKNGSYLSTPNYSCSLTDPARPAIDFSNPVYADLKPADMANVNTWGLYTMYGPNPQFLGNLDLSYMKEWGTPTIPYTGLRPGNVKGYMSTQCYKFYLDGRRVGKWVSAGTHTESWQTATPTGSTVPNPDCTPVTDPVTGIVTYDCPNGELPYIDHEDHPAYTWQLSGNCLPSNANEVNITPNRSWSVYTRSQQQNDYYNGYNPMPGDAYLTNFGAYKNYNGHDAGSAPYDPGFSDSPGSFSSCAQSFAGWFQTGYWKISTPAQINEGTFGFGNGQSGYRLPENPYVFEWQFGNLTPSNLSSGIQWAMTGDYDGTAGWKWDTQTKQTPRTTDSTVMVGVYGFKNGR